jgi:hypothetical protein
MPTTIQNRWPILVVGLLGCNAVFGLDKRSLVDGAAAIRGSDGMAETGNDADAGPSDSTASGDQGPSGSDASDGIDATLDAANVIADANDAMSVAQDAALDAANVIADANDAMSVAQDATDAQDSGSCVPITSGLLGHWTMDNTTLNGTQLTDTSGNGNNGTLVGFPTPATVSGKFGQALSYSRSGAQVDIPTLALDRSAGAVNSVSLWYYRSNSTTINDVLMFMPANPQYAVWLVQWLPQTTGLFLCFNTAVNDCFGAQDSASTFHDSWVHVVAMFSNGPTVQSALYIDGQNAEPICQTAVGFQVCNQQRTVAAPVVLGGNSMYPFRGWLDEVRIYNRALTAIEVTALYNGNACP